MQELEERKEKIKEKLRGNLNNNQRSKIQVGLYMLIAFIMIFCVIYFARNIAWIKADPCEMCEKLGNVCMRLVE